MWYRKLEIQAVWYVAILTGCALHHLCAGVTKVAHAKYGDQLYRLGGWTLCRGPCVGNGWISSDTNSLRRWVESPSAPDCSWWLLGSGRYITIIMVKARVKSSQWLVPLYHWTSQYWTLIPRPRNCIRLATKLCVRESRKQPCRLSYTLTVNNSQPNVELVIQLVHGC